MSNTPEVALYQDNQITIFATEQLLNKEYLVLSVFPISSSRYYTL